MRLLAVALVVGWVFLYYFATQAAPASAHASNSSNLPGNTTCLSPVPTPPSGQLSPAPTNAIKLNEVLTTPTTRWNCSATSETSLENFWVELFNSGNQPFNLYSATNFLDYGPNTLPFHFPANSSIPAHGYFVLFPLSSPTFSHSAINRIRLYINGLPANDTLQLPTLPPNTSYARLQDGTGNWQITDAPTIGASNVPAPPSSGNGNHPGKGKGSTRKHKSKQPVGSIHRSRSASGQTNTSTDSQQGASTGTAIVQMPWKQIHLPASSSANLSPIATQPPSGTGINNAVQPPSGARDFSHKILLSLLLFALAGSLYWCFKLFSPAAIPRIESDKAM